MTCSNRSLVGSSTMPVSQVCTQKQCCVSKNRLQVVKYCILCMLSGRYQHALCQADLRDLCLSLLLLRSRLSRLLLLRSPLSSLDRLSPCRESPLGLSLSFDLRSLSPDLPASDIVVPSAAGGAAPLPTSCLSGAG